MGHSGLNSNQIIYIVDKDSTVDCESVNGADLTVTPYVCHCLLADAKFSVRNTCLLYVWLIKI